MHVHLTNDNAAHFSHNLPISESRALPHYQPMNVYRTLWSHNTAPACASFTVRRIWDWLPGRRSLSLIRTLISI